MALFCKDIEPEFTLAGDKSLVLLVRLSWRVASDTADACGRGLSTFFFLVPMRMVVAMYIQYIASKAIQLNTIELTH